MTSVTMPAYIGRIGSVHHPFRMEIHYHTAFSSKKGGSLKGDSATAIAANMHISPGCGAMAVADHDHTQHIRYPEIDGKPLSETDMHIDVLMYLPEALKDHFRDNPQILSAH